jgi:hypothetical protein
MWELFYLCSIGSAFSVINFSKCQKCIQPIKTPLFDVVTSQPLCGTLVTSQPLCGTHQKNKYILRELDLFYIPRTLKL